MGLDIAVYCNLVFVANETKRSQYKTEDEYKKAYSKYADQDYINLYNLKDLKKRGDGVKYGWYSGDRVYNFPAGSYLSYNNWRIMLAEMLGTTPEDIWNNKYGPFVELIAFADNEGFIGPETSEKLYSDFHAHKAIAKEYSKTTKGLWDGDQWLILYNDFKKAFKLATECNGVVRFS